MTGGLCFYSVFYLYCSAIYKLARDWIFFTVSSMLLSPARYMRPFSVMMSSICLSAQRCAPDTAETRSKSWRLSA